ncbi:MAG: cupin domain-containing protein [Fusobacteriota bacterium]
MLIKKESVNSNAVSKPRDGKGFVDAFAYLKSEDLSNGLQGFNVMELRPNSEIGYHQHVDDEEIYFILSGSGIVNDNGESKNVTSGDLIYTAQGEFHGLKNKSNEVLKFIAFIINKS